ncbi:hypothetical protein CHS0354_037819 [Potamilus streckersoni]|uniref:DUF7042 domain-containing protein n=1 Tax=Potamilus streckersoni TaxID=2493646 RepID=A0AAE0VXC5_9BIVA|nr:hypothetical protein CHS0354_037819 [Potamilus streckersoni]
MSGVDTKLRARSIIITAPIAVFFDVAALACQLVFLSETFCHLVIISKGEMDPLIQAVIQIIHTIMLLNRIPTDNSKVKRNSGDAACTWPTFIAAPSLWKDSDKGSLFFKNSTNMDGWIFKIITTVTTQVSEWQCFSHNITSSEGILVLRSPSSYSYFSGTVNLYRPYICMYLTKITDYSYQYYLKTDEQQYAGNYERVYMHEENNASAVDPTVSQLCSGTPQISEYHLLIRNGLESFAKLQCPDIILGNYRYTFTSQSTSCGTGTEYWNVCSDNQVMTFDYTKCSTVIAYSTSGSVYCVNNITDGTNTYVSVYNTDTSPTYQITCFMVSLSGTDSTTGATNLSVSQSPNSCTKTQTTTSVPINAQSVTLGAYMFLRAYSVLVLLSIILAICLIHKCKTPVEPEKTPPPPAPEVFVDIENLPHEYITAYPPKLVSKAPSGTTVLPNISSSNTFPDIRLVFDPINKVKPEVSEITSVTDLTYHSGQ